MLHLPTGTYLKFDRSAALILDLLAETGVPATAAARLAKEVAIPLPRAAEDVQSVVTALDRLQRQAPCRPRRPRIRTSARHVRAWWALPLRMRWAVAQVVAVLCAVEIGLHTLDVRRTARLFHTPLGGPDAVSASASGAVGASASGAAGLRSLEVIEPAEPAVDPGDPRQLRPAERRVLAAIDWVAARWLSPVTCLRRALLTGFFFRRRQPVLRLGLMEDGVTAHAWVEAEGAGWGMKDVVRTFQPVFCSLRTTTVGATAATTGAQGSRACGI